MGNYVLKFVMEKSKVKYGQIFGVPAYEMLLKDCELRIKDGEYPDWFAVYLRVPKTCSSRGLVRALENNGADFIFLIHEESDEPSPKLLPHDIEVPVYELDLKQNSNFIKELQSKGDGTILTITMPYPKSANGTASMELFYTPTNFRSFKYIEEIEKVIEGLGQHVTFEPFLVLFSNSRNPNSKNCRETGRYCAPDPDNDGKFSGRDVVNEMLRQKCVYKLASNEWIAYMKGWHQNCAADISRECSEKVLKKFTKISVTKLQDCYDGSEIRMSGAPEGQNDNTMLEAEMEKLKGSHEMTFPALYINGQRFEGHVKSTEILIKSCDTFDFKPQACTEVQLEYDGQHMSIVWSVLIYLYVLMLGLIVIAFACIGIAKRVARREVNFEVKKSVANYYALKDSEPLA